MPSQKHVVETFFGFDEESVDSETLSETSCNTDRTDRAPATPEEDLDDVSAPRARHAVWHFRPLCPHLELSPQGTWDGTAVVSGEVVPFAGSGRPAALAGVGSLSLSSTGFTAD